MKNNSKCTSGHSMFRHKLSWKYNIFCNLCKKDNFLALQNTFSEVCFLPFCTSHKNVFFLQIFCMRTCPDVRLCFFFITFWKFHVNLIIGALRSMCQNAIVRNDAWTKFWRLWAHPSSTKLVLCPYMKNVKKNIISKNMVGFSLMRTNSGNWKRNASHSSKPNPNSWQNHKTRSHMAYSNKYIWKSILYHEWQTYSSTNMIYDYKLVWSISRVFRDLQNEVLNFLEKNKLTGAR
jgi:hypothetical protein